MTPTPNCVVRAKRVLAVQATACRRRSGGPSIIEACFLLGFIFLLPGAGHADSPAVEHPGIRGHRVAPAGRDVCWSEPGDLNGLIASSEQILAFGLESEIANDFMIDGAVITRAAWWGSYYNERPCDEVPSPPGFNLRFYEDAECLPGVLVADFPVTSFTEELIDCMGGLLPMYKWSAGLGLELTPSVRYWFAAQIMDHPYPPQGGRLAAFYVTGCESVFKGVYFGYPDWVSCEQVFGESYDASQEFECETATPVARSTWGAIRRLYR